MGTFEAGTHPAFLAAIDRMLTELLDERYLGFDNEADRMAFYHERARRTARRARAQVCIYPGCLNRSVKRSHTLPRRGPLESIAENGHVITPTFDVERGFLDARRIGVGEASTFPGFCKIHEGLFQDFEQRKEPASGDEHVRQFFRLVCREIRVRELQIEHLRVLITDLEDMLCERGTELLKRIVGQRFLNENKLTPRVRFSRINSWHADTLERIAESEISVEGLKKDFLQPLQAIIEGREGRDAEYLEFLVATADCETPVCLAGRGNFHCKIDGQVRNTIVLGQVWPFDGGTQIAFLVRGDRKRDFEVYFDTFATRFIGLLSLIESWMVHGTDHWFVQPSVWRSLPIARQGQILKDIGDGSKSIACEYPFSIFDDIRARELSRSVREGSGDAAQLEDERRKLSNEPM